MRILVFLLILANLFFFAWTRGYLGVSDPDALRSSDQLRPDQIRIVSNDRAPVEKRVPGVAGEANSAPTEPPPSVASPSHGEACFVLSDVPQTEADSLERLFAEKLPAFRLLRTTMSGNSYWVHIPSFKTRREAEIRVEELKRLGVKEYFIMQENNDSFTISLGLFSTQGAAEFTLAALRDKGVRAVRMIERPRKSALSQIELLGPESQAMEMQQLLDQVLPQVKPGVCERSNRSTAQ
jgi:cell division septation protein DedD